MLFLLSFLGCTSAQDEFKLQVLKSVEDDATIDEDELAQLKAFAHENFDEKTKDVYMKDVKAISDIIKKPDKSDHVFSESINEPSLKDYVFLADLNAAKNEGKLKNLILEKVSDGKLSDSDNKTIKEFVTNHIIKDQSSYLADVYVISGIIDSGDMSQFAQDFSYAELLNDGEFVKNIKKAIESYKAEKTKVKPQKTQKPAKEEEKDYKSIQIMMSGR